MMAAIALVLVASACGQSHEPGQARTSKKRKRGAVRAASPPVAGGIRRGPSRGFVGVVVAREATDVAATVPGKVTKVHVRLGDRLEAKAPIATIDPRPIRDELAVARASLSAARADLNRAAVDRREAAERLRLRRSLKDNVSAEELTTAKYALEKAKARGQRARALVANHSAKIRQLERKLADAKIVAPFKGTVSTRYVDPGVVVSTGTRIVRLIASDELWVRFAVPAAQAGPMQVGAKVRVEIESMKTPIEATIKQVAPELDAVTQMILIEAAIKQPPELAGRLQSGLAAWVKLPRSATP
jgi:RND family efflux transporter MFP subunit